MGVTGIFPDAFEQEHEKSWYSCSQCVSRGSWQRLCLFSSTAAIKVHVPKNKEELDGTWQHPYPNTNLAIPNVSRVQEICNV